MIAVLFLSSRNYQREPALQIASAVGLSAAALPAYLAAHGRLEPAAYWIWALCAAHSAASVLVVHARLEAIVASRKPSNDSATTGALLPHRRTAVLAQAILWICLAIVAVEGKPWLMAPFVPPCLLHWRELWQLGAGGPSRVSMQRVGWIQLGAAVAFGVLLIVVLRISPL